MLDPLMRRLIDPPLAKMAAMVVRLPVGISANKVTLAGFILGLVACALAAQGHFLAALGALLLNRLADGLDGAIARHNGAESDIGAYLDIVCDFIIWALLPLAFIAHAMSMTVFLAFAIMAEKKGLKSQAQGKKHFFYLSGLAEGTETIGFFVFVMLFPAYFSVGAMVFALIVGVSVIGRILAAMSSLTQSKE
jgi:phosphatidylglycerophosphate synthase